VTLTDEQKREILAEVIELTTPPQMRPGDVTVKDIAQAAGITDRKAYDRLQEMAGRDGWEIEKVLHDGHRIWVLRKAGA